MSGALIYRQALQEGRKLFDESLSEAAALLLSLAEHEIQEHGPALGVELMRAEARPAGHDLQVSDLDGGKALGLSHERRAGTPLHATRRQRLPGGPSRDGGAGARTPSGIRTARCNSRSLNRSRGVGNSRRGPSFTSACWPSCCCRASLILDGWILSAVSRRCDARRRSGSALSR